MSDRIREPKELQGEEALAQHIAETCSISVRQANELMRRYGNDLKKITEAAVLFRDK